MKFTIIDAPQRSPEWRTARAGRLTGSNAHLILLQGRKKGEESTQRRDYRLQLVAERIAGIAQERFFFTEEMQRGIDLEPLAFGRYEAECGELLRHTGFIQCAAPIMAGCSLDGDINGFSGIVELKCPKIATHLAYWQDPRRMLEDYSAQVRHNLWVTNAAYCDLISFDDRLPAHRQFLRWRIERYDADIPGYELEALKFLDEVDAQYKMIMEAA